MQLCRNTRISANCFHRLTHMYISGICRSVFRPYPQRFLVGVSHDARDETRCLLVSHSNRSHDKKYRTCDSFPVHFSVRGRCVFALKMSALGEYYSFRKIFRDLQKYITVGLSLYQARRTDTDAKFGDLFQSLDSQLGPLETQQRKIGERAAE